MEKLRNTLFRDWNFMRWLRLAMGLIIAYQAFAAQNGLLGLLACIFIFQALANAACCGAGSCSTGPGKTDSGKSKEIEFEEINRS